MKIFVLTLFLFLSVVIINPTYAANTTMTFNYPTSSVKYEKLMINNVKGTSPYCQNTPGLVYMDPTTNDVVICDAVSGSTSPYTADPYPEECFDRYTNNATGQTCPVNYTLATSSGSTIIKSFSPSTGIDVYITTCCYSGSTVLPAS